MTPRIVFAIAGLSILASAPAAAADTATLAEPGLSTSLLPSWRGSAQSGTPILLAAVSPLAIEDRLPVVELPPPPARTQAIDLTAEAADLFQRIRNGFSMPDIHSDLVLYHMQWYQNRPDYLRRMVERSSRYLHFIVGEIEKRGMPTELALLPMVESAYNPTAYSRSHASGLWQFIPATGKRYKLDQDWWKDERRDIVASTGAALDYLQWIYEMHGDWHLALASYNWGEGAVGRAIEKNQAQELPTDYLSLTMPAETRNYVPKLQALKNIFSNPTLVAELRLPAVANRPYFSTVTRPGNIDIKVAAELAEMPVQEFVALNPAHKRPVIRSDSPMVIPAEKLDTFINNLEAHESGNKPLSSWQAYTLRPGDKLEKIAPRFGMTVANLKAVNGISGSIRLSPGFTLLVSGGEAAGTLDMVPLPEQPEIAAAPEPAPAAEPRSHTVRKGETLQSIARRYDMTVPELVRLNHLRKTQVNAGTRLQLAATERATAKEEAKSVAGGARSRVDEKAARSGVRNAEAPPKLAAKEKSSGKAAKVAHYTVKPGDTIFSIARRFNVDTDDLMRWNRISPVMLKAGRTLTIQLAQNP